MLRAAIGFTELQHLQRWNARRRELTAVYIEALDRHAPEVFLPFRCPKETAAHLMPVLPPPGAHRETVMSDLRCRGIQSSIHYPPVHKFSYYRARFPAPALPNTEEFCSRELSLPLHPALTDQDVERIATTLGDEVHKACASKQTNLRFSARNSPADYQRTFNGRDRASCVPGIARERILLSREARCAW